MQITTYISRCYCFRTHYFQNTHLIFYARDSTFGLCDATLYCHVAKFSFLFSQSGLQFWSFWSGYVWTGPNLNFTDKRAYKIRAELNVFKHFRDFKHFLPRERTLQATDHHHFSRFLEKIAPIDRLHSTVSSVGWWANEAKDQQLKKLHVISLSHGLWL